MIALLSLTAVPWLAHATGTAPHTYKVAASFAAHGEVFASPSAIVRAGQPAHITVSGSNGYDLVLTVTRTDGNMSSRLILHAGQPATVSVGKLKATFTVQPRHTEHP